MRTGLHHALSILGISAAIVLGTLHDIQQSPAQDEGPAGACAKGSEQSNSTLATAYMKAFSTADDRVFDEILSVDYKHHFGIGEDAATPAAFKRRVVEWNTAFRGGSFDIEQIITSGDTVVIRWKRTGKQVSAYEGIGPSATESTYTGINIFRIKCNRVAESWEESDHLGRLKAAGLLTSEKLSGSPSKP